MKTKVLHVVHRLDIGGLERVLLNCINSLPEAQFEHRIVALTGYSEDFKNLLAKPVEVISLNKREGNDWRIFKRFYDQVKIFQPHCVHTYNLATVELQFIAWLSGVKLRVHAEHGRDIFDPSGANKKYRLLRKVLSPFITKIIPVSRDLYDWLLNDVGIRRKKLQLILNGISTSNFYPATKSDFGKRPFVFGHVGRLAKIKNQQLLVRAFKQASQISADFAAHCQLVIIGGGECFDELNTLIDEFGLQNHIYLPGPKLDMRAEYAGIDVFVMSSLAEGIPMTLLESMACEIPPVVTRVGGIPEVVDASCGMLYESQDQDALATIMLEMFNQPEKVQQLGKNAREKIVSVYSEEAMVEAYRQIYQGSI